MTVDPDSLWYLARDGTLCWSGTAGLLRFLALDGGIVGNEAAWSEDLASWGPIANGSDTAWIRDALLRMEEDTGVHTTLSLPSGMDKLQTPDSMDTDKVFGDAEPVGSHPVSDRRAAASGDRRRSGDRRSGGGGYGRRATDIPASAMRAGDNFGRRATDGPRPAPASNSGKVIALAALPVPLAFFTSIMLDPSPDDATHEASAAQEMPDGLDPAPADAPTAEPSQQPTPAAAKPAEVEAEKPVKAEPSAAAQADGAATNEEVATKNADETPSDEREAAAKADVTPTDKQEASHIAEDSSEDAPTSTASEDNEEQAEPKKAENPPTILSSPTQPKNAGQTLRIVRKDEAAEAPNRAVDRNSEVTEAMNLRTNIFDACVGRAQRSHPGFRGMIAFSVSIGSDGRIRGISGPPGNRGGQFASGCLLGELGHLSFTPGKPSRVIYRYHAK